MRADGQGLGRVSADRKRGPSLGGWQRRLRGGWVLQEMGEVVLFRSQKKGLIQGSRVKGY